ncbi:ABC transporter ATP-binding protein [Anaerotignum sp.]|uniref:ABC transporter ATP-binding protein n=1 Tax=Anaerotignum sp. TaxID=2039241 RepID=UPI0027150173|nr:ABC transporter ATP-binding protein [Anaerotignum sp.]
MNKIIEVSGLTKSYGNKKAVNDLSFYIEKGKMFSFLGPNGAGKSTTIDILCTLLDFDGGECVIGGWDLRHDSQKIRQTIGIVFQDHVLDDLLTVRENLIARAGLYTLDKKKIKNFVYEAVQATELSEIMDYPYGKLSGGQRRRVDIARALLQKPQILFLDEPTTGLDPQTRKSIWDTIKRLQSENRMTVFLTTHYMEEAAESDYVIVIDHGTIVAKGTPSELKTRYSSDTLRLFPSDHGILCGILNELQLNFKEICGELRIELSDTMAAIPILERCKDCISGFQVLQGTMDDAFMGITGRELR